MSRNTLSETSMKTSFSGFLRSVPRLLLLTLVAGCLPGCVWFQNPPAPDVTGPPAKPGTVMSPTSAPANADPHSVSTAPLP